MYENYTYHWTVQVEELRRKYSARIQEQEEQIETLLVKINNLEKQKSRLQSEVEVLIIDLEKVRFEHFYTLVYTVSFISLFVGILWLLNALIKERIIVC